MGERRRSGKRTSKEFDEFIIRTHTQLKNNFEKCEENLNNNTMTNTDNLLNVIYNYDGLKD